MCLRLFIATLAAVCLASAATAGSISFEASADRTQVTLGERITLTVTVSGEDTGVEQPKLPPLSDFDVVGRNSSSSTQISIVGGQVSSQRTVSFLYYLRPRREGTLTIGPAELEHEGRVYRTTPITVEVTKESMGPARQGPGVGGDDDLTLKGSPDRRQVYVGEQITIEYKLYARVQLSNVQLARVPSYSGFWTENLFQAQTLGFQRTVANGLEYNVALIKKVALFPTSAGRYSIEPMEVQCEVPVRSARRGIFDFDNFGLFSRTQTVVVRSEPVTIEVQPLPEAGRPADFSGAVGRFTVRAMAAPLSVKAGDPVSLKIVVSGTGNVQAVADLPKPDLTDFKVYDPKVTTTPRREDGRVGGMKTFEYVLIPKVPGTLKVPGVSFAYFDPERRGYETVRTEPISLIVAPGAKEEGAAAASELGREEVRAVGRDIRFIKPDAAELEDQGGDLYRSGGFWALQFVPVLAFVGVALYKRHRDRMERDVAYVRRRRAKGEAAKRLRAARRLLDQGTSTEFHAEVYRALSSFLADRLNLPTGGLTVDELAERLTVRGIEPEVVEGIREAFGRCDFARFAPSQVPREEMEALYERTEGIIGGLERRI